MLILLAFTAATSAPPPSHPLAHGALSIRFSDDLSAVITIAGHGDAVALPPAVFLGGKMRQLGNSDFTCKLANDGAPTSGTDVFGRYSALSVNCTVNGLLGQLPLLQLSSDKAAGRLVDTVAPADTGMGVGAGTSAVDYSVKVYAVAGHPTDTMVLFDVSFPGGAEGLRMRPVQVGNRSPPQFAPFPAFNLTQTVSPALGRDALAMCYGSERPHLLAFNGVAGFPGQCNTLSGGMAVTAWPTPSSPSGMAGAVWTAANQFHLNFHQVVDAPAPVDLTSAKRTDGGSVAIATATAATKVWVHGVSGEIASVPVGWEQRTMLYYSGQGINAAVDGWGTTLRQAHNTTKNDAEDLFLQTVSYWTDNGAAGNGAAWKTTAAAPPKASHGAYLQLNYTMVDEEHLGVMMDSIAISGGVRPRASQIDCWWCVTCYHRPVSQLWTTFATHIDHFCHP
jgi:hypothetical protein